MRTIKVQIATAKNHRIGTAAESGPEQLRQTALSVLAVDRTGQRIQGLGPLSIEAGIAVFNGDVEPQITVTVHEGTPERALEVWHRLRGIPGVDCGRIYDRGRSWCVKAYANEHGETWPRHKFTPIECKV